MFKLLKMQYQKWHKITKEDVAHAVEMKKLTAKEYEEIVGEKYSVPMAEIKPVEKEEPKTAELTSAKGVEE